MTQEADQRSSNSWMIFQRESETDVEQMRKELEEIDLMIEQSQLEVEKLVQRNSSITAHLQQIQSNFDTMPRPDIRATYDAALEAQQRLFVMRGQLEKLQSDKNHLEKSIQLQERISDLVSQGLPNTTGGGGKVNQATAEKLEMVIQAQEAERQRLSQQMHDGPAQALSNFILQTEIAMRLFEINPAKAKEELGSLKLAATSTFQKVRDFITELRPMMLDDLGLVPTLRRYVDSYSEHTEIDIRFNVMGVEQRFEPYIEVMIFRSLQELLSNAIRHSQASQVKILVDISPSAINLTVEDNGRGFDAEELEQRGGMGLKIIKDRVEMLGGQFEVMSRPGDGTRIHFLVPVVR
jgi:two-component system, NarL family, sensor histidine kinase DegS